MGEHLCPNGHSVRPATGLSCMRDSGYFWCGRCVSEPGGVSMNGGPMMGMYWPPSMVVANSATNYDARVLVDHRDSRVAAHAERIVKLLDGGTD